MSSMRFTGVARLQIMAILNEKTKGKALDPGHVTATALYKKIYIPDKQQEEELAYPSVDDQPPQLNPMKVRAMRILEVDLDFEELTKLYNVLKEFEGIRPLDHDLWFDDIMAQLDEAKKPPIQDKDTRDRNLRELKAQSRR